MNHSAPSTSIELAISCKNLKNLDILTKSDPQVILYVFNNGSWREYDKTEVINNNLNPKFTHVFRIDYRFEEVQPLKFVVLDIDDRKTSEFIGATIVNLSQIVGAPGQVLTRYLRSNDDIGGNSSNTKTSRGMISIRAEEVSGTNDVVIFDVEGKDFPKKSLIFKNQPYLVISRANIEDSSMHPVYNSEAIKSSSPKWKRFQIPVSKLCNGDYSRALKFEIFDYRSNGNHKFIGEFHSKLEDLLKFKRGQEFPIFSARKRAKMEKKGKTYINSGYLVWNLVQIQHNYTFLDYVRGGYELNLIVAIDFTYSNKVPSDPSSLHFIHPNGILNGYQRAILDVGRILLDYDKDKLVPVFGFGAKIPVNGGQYQLSHCFPCNFNWNNPQVNGLDGIMNSYINALNNCQLYGPTNFSNIIRNAVQLARSQTHAYQILLILTDGEITDMQQTVDEIVMASRNVPLSIVIVGIGNSNFSNMHTLDADDHPLISSTGEKMSRDIVQFVEFNRFSGDPPRLAQEVLYEIPHQFITHMKLNKIVPPDRIKIDSFQNLEISKSFTGNINNPLTTQGLYNQNFNMHQTQQSQQPYSNIQSYPNPPNISQSSFPQNDPYSNVNVPSFESVQKNSYENSPYNGMPQQGPPQPQPQGYPHQGQSQGYPQQGPPPYNQSISFQSPPPYAPHSQFSNGNNLNPSIQISPPNNSSNQQYWK